jgi:cytochrome c-type biogenesis protein CcmE
MNRNMLMGGVLVAVCAVVAFASLRDSTVNAAQSFDNVPKQPGERLQVYGILDTGSIRSIKGAHQVAFDLVEEKTHKRLHVLYDNAVVALPANFPAASHAKATGEYDPVNARFVSSDVLTKCPSKYDAGSLNLAQKKAIDKWQKVTGLAEAPSAGS